MRFRASRILSCAALAGVLLFAGRQPGSGGRDQSLLHRRRLDQGGARCLRRLYRLGLDRQGQAGHRAQRPGHGLLRHPRSRRGHRRDGRSGEDRRDQAQLLFHARRGLRGQEGLRQGHRRSRRGHQARCRATATISCCAASSIATRAISTGRLSNSTRRSSSILTQAERLLQARRSLPHAERVRPFGRRLRPGDQDRA